jgi:hypothetical protein
VPRAASRRATEQRLNARLRDGSARLIAKCKRRHFRTHPVRRMKR